MALVGKLQRNPSTLKLIRNTATGKLIRTNPNTMPSECAHCPDVQPAFFRLSMSNFVNADCCLNTYTGEHSYKPINIAQSLNGRTVKVPHFTSCTYRILREDYYEWDGLRCFDNSDCSGDGIRWPLDQFQYEVTIQTTDVKIEIWSWCGGYSQKCFDGRVNYEDCMEISGMASNLITSCDYYSIWVCPKGLGCPTPNSGQVIISL